MARGAAVPATVTVRIAATLLLLLAAYLACRNAVILAVGRSAPQVAASLPPASGEALVRMQMGAARPSPDAARAAIARGMARAPLSELPFLLAAEIARGRGELRQSRTLASTAVQRQSRSEYTRGRMLQIHLQRGRWNEAIDEMRLLWQPRSPANALLVKALLLMAKDDRRARALLVRKLRENDGWRKAFLALARKEHRGSPVVALLREAVADRGSGDPRRLSLRGYDAWIAALPARDLPLAGAVYDGTFSSGSGDAPFEWSLAAQGNAIASAPGDGLHISLATRGPQQLARQHLALPPAPLRIEVDYARQGAGSLVWSLHCLDGRPVATLALAQRQAAGLASAPVAVPPGCPLQRLTLTGNAGSGGPLDATIDRIEIVPAL